MAYQDLDSLLQGSTSPESCDAVARFLQHPGAGLERGWAECLEDHFDHFVRTQFAVAGPGTLAAVAAEMLAMQLRFQGCVQEFQRKNQALVVGYAPSQRVWLDYWVAINGFAEFLGSLREAQEDSPRRIGLFLFAWLGRLVKGDTEVEGYVGHILESMVALYLGSSSVEGYPSRDHGVAGESRCAGCVAARAAPPAAVGPAGRLASGAVLAFRRAGGPGDEPEDRPGLFLVPPRHRRQWEGAART